MGIDQYHLQLSFIGKAKIRVFCNDKVIKEADVKIFPDFSNFLVNEWSDWLGLGCPEEWLCASNMATA